MIPLTWQRRREASQPGEAPDAFVLGRRLNALRKQRGLTLAQAGEAVGIAASHLSLIENGKREPKLTTVRDLARHYGVSIDEVLAGPTDRRTQLEIELEAAMKSPLAVSRGLPSIRVGPRTPNDVLEAMIALHRELHRVSEEHIATPEEARRANTELRLEMRSRSNHYPHLEAQATELLAAVGHVSGPVGRPQIEALTQHLGFTLRFVDDLPTSTRSVADLRLRRIYLERSPDKAGHDQRSVQLQALAHQVLGHKPPKDYAEFLRQRVETNYLAGALTLPEASVVEYLRAAKQARDISADGLQEAFAVSYETAAHRITNLLTHHFDLPVHFAKVHLSGTIYKAYENDGLLFPMDHTGAIEGQPVCRFWAARQIFELDASAPYVQYTDTPRGTFFDSTRIERTTGGPYSVGLGTTFDHAKWFRGRETRERTKSTCPDDDCCRRPPAELLKRWGGRAWPSARARTHMLAALPPGAFPGVDETEVYRFLEVHAEQP